MEPEASGVGVDMRWWRAVVIPMVLAGTLLGAAPAYGHVALLSTNPAEGASLDTPPSQAVLVFSESLNRDLTQVALTVNDVPTPPPAPRRITGGTLTVPLPESSGRFRIVYRAVGSDGHRIDGQLRFTVSGTGHSHPAPADPAPAIGGSEAPANVTADDRNAPWWPVALGALLLLGTLAYVLTIGRNRGKDTSSSVATTTESHDPGDQPGQHPGDSGPDDRPTG
jgi:methionine-rich copper-binding protein CopC